MKYESQIELGLRSSIRRFALASKLMAGASLVTLVATDPVNAQMAGSGSSGATGVETVVVTGQKVSSDVQSLPLSVLTLNAAAIDESNAYNLVQLDGMVPGVTINATGIGAPTINIRGVGNEGYTNNSSQPGVSINENGVYIAAPGGIGTGFLDIGQIEIFKGPQGTVLGEGSDGGALNVNTVQPVVGTYSVGADASYGSYDYVRSQVSANVPIGDTMAVRVALRQESHDGWSTATQIPGDPNFGLDDENSYEARLTYLWQITPQLSMNIWGEYYSNDSHTDGAKNIFDPNPDPRQVSEDFPGYSTINSTVVAGTIAYDFGWATLKTIASYQNVTNNQSYDDDRLDYALADQMYGGHYLVNSALSSPSAHTAEIDLASPSDQRVSWIVGAFYLHQINNVATIQYENTASGPMPINYNPSPAQLTAMYADGLYNGFENKSLLKHTANAIYAQGVYHITPALNLTAGARYTWDYSTGAVSSYYSSYTDINTSFEKLTGKVSLDYNLTDDNMVYVTASKGVKPGGTNLTYVQLVKPTYLPESVDEIEVGSKNEFFDNNLRINGDVFYNDYQNMQMDSDDILPYDGGMTNVGLVHTYGVELDAAAILPYNFRLEGNIASMGGRVNSHTTLLDPVVTTSCDQRYGPFSPQDLACRAAAEESVYDHTPGKLPPLSTNITLSRQDTLPFGGTLESSIRGIYRAGYFFRVFDNPVSDKVPSMYRLDTSFKYMPDGTNFYGEFLITNLTNDADINARVAENFGLGVVSNIYVPPRQFILRIGYSM